MCKCINNAPDLTIEDRNHRAISDGFNQVEMIQRLNEVVAEMAAERVRLMDTIHGLQLELHRYQGSN